MTPKIPVALLRCSEYSRKQLKSKLHTLLQSLDFSVRRGSKVLLKPNLVSGRGHGGLACSNPQFAAAVAELFIDYGAEVKIGDSPAFGSAREVMHRFGYRDAFASLPVRQIDFSPGPLLPLSNGVSVRIAREALDCDLLVNLPRIKAHCQLRITLSVKNLFGTVLGWRKPLLHLRLGEKNNAFARMLADLAALFPAAFHLIDGIVAMHRSGPIDGEPFSLGVIGAAFSPVGLDTALLRVVDADPGQSPLWRECHRRQLTGSLFQDLSFPLHSPQELQVQNFILPAALTPIRFHPLHAMKSLGRRLLAE